MARVRADGLGLLLNRQWVFCDQRHQGRRVAQCFIGHPRPAAKRLAAELGVTPNQVALAWLLHQDFPVIPILGTADVAGHLMDALGTAQSVCRRINWIPSPSCDPAPLIHNPFSAVLYVGRGLVGRRRNRL